MANFLGERYCWFKRSVDNNPLQVDDELPQDFLDENDVIELDDSSQIAADTVDCILDKVMSHLATRSPSQFPPMSAVESVEINQNKIDSISVVNVVTKAVKVTDTSFSSELGILNSNNFFRLNPIQWGREYQIPDS